MDDNVPCIRMDLDFLPVQHEGTQFIMIRDHLGLVEEGKAVGPPLYQLMALLDGSRTLRDLQADLMRQRGGVLVSNDEVIEVINHLDDAFILDSERFRSAKEEMERAFAASKLRHCSHCGLSYPDDSAELKKWLDQILAAGTEPAGQEEKIAALVSPHIDISVGNKVYGTAYRVLEKLKPKRIFVLGVGHYLREGLFCLTDKDFETPLGITKSDKAIIDELKDAGGESVSRLDIEHKNEHSIEFQLIFLQHLLGAEDFKIIPILCGSLQPLDGRYDREGYTEKADLFLSRFRDILGESKDETLLLGGIDLSHIGPKFGHEATAMQMESQAGAHDAKLLECFCSRDIDGFWEESIKVQDRYNVCGFSAMACMLEVLPPCKGKVLDYNMWHEEATRSAVSFSAVVFTN
ncbi:AmmeMemoRadiSam system protein B [Thermodesulfobacteriota bacterium]